MLQPGSEFGLSSDGTPKAAHGNVLRITRSSKEMLCVCVRDTIASLVQDA